MGYKTREWRDSMRVTLDYNNMTDTFLGDKGFSDKQLATYRTAAAKAYAYVKENRGKDELFMGWTELPYNQKEIVADILETAKNVRRKFKYFVVLGIGGSAARSWRLTRFAICTTTICRKISGKVRNSTWKTTLIP